MVKIPIDLPPNIPEGYPYEIWKREIEIGVSRHMLLWRQEGISDDQVIFLAWQMIELTCTKACLHHQTLLEYEFGADRTKAYHFLLRRAASWIAIDLSKLEPPRRADYRLTNQQTFVMPPTQRDTD